MADIHEEWTRNLRAKRPDLGVEKIKRRRAVPRPPP
jgi:hypothetical protein